MPFRRPDRPRSAVALRPLAAAALLALLAAGPAREDDRGPAARPPSSHLCASAANTGGAQAVRGRRTPSPLLRWQFLVGQWRGVGQPRRGSTRGAWRETLTWRWDFSGNAARLVGTPRDSKLYRALEIAWDEDRQRAVFEVVLTGGERLAFEVAGDSAAFSSEALAKPPQTGVASGSIPQKNPAPTTDWVYRLDCRRRNDDRFVLTLYKRPQSSRSFVRVAEVAYQRQGTRLAAFDTSGPVCVVTGGRGTIAVTHAGKTYYVCCSGCREAFEADPEGILREYFESRRKDRSTGPSQP